MNDFLSDKHVIFFDVGYTIDYPASGDWMFTNRFYELAEECLKQCSETKIRKAREAGAGFLDRDHLIRTQEEKAEQFYQYYRF